MHSRKLAALRILKAATGEEGFMAPNIQAPIPAPNPHFGALGGNSSATANHDPTAAQTAKSPMMSSTSTPVVPSRNGAQPVQSFSTPPTKQPNLGVNMRTGSLYGSQKLAALAKLSSAIMPNKMSATTGMPATGGEDAQRIAPQVDAIVKEEEEGDFPKTANAGLKTLAKILGGGALVGGAGYGGFKLRGKAEDLKDRAQATFTPENANRVLDHMGHSGREIKDIANLYGRAYDREHDTNITPLDIGGDVVAQLKVSPEYRAFRRQLPEAMDQYQGGILGGTAGAAAGGLGGYAGSKLVEALTGRQSGLRSALMALGGAGLGGAAGAAGGQEFHDNLNKKANEMAMPQDPMGQMQQEPQDPHQGVDEAVKQKMQYKWRDKIMKIEQGKKKLDLQRSQADDEMRLEHQQLQEAEHLKAEQKAFDEQHKAHQQMAKAQAAMPQFPMGQPSPEAQQQQPATMQQHPGLARQINPQPSYQKMASVSKRQTTTKEKHQMDAHTKNAVNNVLMKEAGVRLSVNPLADALFGKLAAASMADQEVIQAKKDDNASARPSSSTSPGMEDKNDGYGKSDKKLDDDPSKDGAQSTGTPEFVASGANYTSESSGMKDLSINQHKSACLNFLNATRPSNKSRIRAALAKLAN